MQHFSSQKPEFSHTKPFLKHAYVVQVHFQETNGSSKVQRLEDKVDYNLLLLLRATA